MANKNKRLNYSEHQNFLYNRALFGLSIYTPEEVVIMAAEKRKRIIQIHKKTQKILNLWKQEIVNILANKIFTDIFPDTEITKCFVEKHGIQGDPEYINNMSFKELRITKEHIIAHLIEHKILPKNFNELNQLQDASRISNKRISNPSVKSGERTGGRALEVLSKAR
jgi:hypothetical protein